MYGKAHKIRSTVSAIALAASVALVVIPAAAASTQQAGMVPGKLGSPDPRDSARNAFFSPGIVASRLGSPDPREAATQVLYSPGIVASRLGSQDPRGTADEALSTSSIAASRLGSPDVRDAVASAQYTPVSSNNGFDWGKVGIGIIAVCGLLLLVALGMGARQFRHSGHGLGSA